MTYEYFLVADIGFQEDIPDDPNLEYMEEMFKRAVVARVGKTGDKYTVEIYHKEVRIWLTIKEIKGVILKANVDAFDKDGILVLREMSQNEFVMRLYEGQS